MTMHCYALGKRRAASISCIFERPVIVVTNSGWSPAAVKSLDNKSLLHPPPIFLSVLLTRSPPSCLRALPLNRLPNDMRVKVWRWSPGQGFMRAYQQDPMLPLKADLLVLQRACTRRYPGAFCGCAHGTFLCS